MAPAPSLARRVQRCLELLYKLEPQPSVDDFARPCADGEREQVLVRDEGDGVALAVLLPPAGLEPGGGPLSLDSLCQVIEGVSHFVYLSDRIAGDRPTTQLELELQAEVDKFAVLRLDASARRPRPALDFAGPPAGPRLHAMLYERGRFVHDEGSERGERYRLATALAARFWAGLGATGRPAPAGGGEAAVRRLRDFHRAGQADKIRLARAA